MPLVEREYPLRDSAAKQFACTRKQLHSHANSRFRPGRKISRDTAVPALCVKTKESATGRAVEGSVGKGFSAVPGCHRYSAGRAACAGEQRCNRWHHVATRCACAGGTYEKSTTSRSWSIFASTSLALIALMTHLSTCRAEAHSAGENTVRHHSCYSRSATDTRGFSAKQSTPRMGRSEALGSFRPVRSGRVGRHGLPDLRAC